MRGENSPLILVTTKTKLTLINYLSINKEEQ